MSTKLTKRMIDSLPLATNPKGARYYDPTLTGFGLVVYPSGKKSFFLEYGARGKRRRMTLGQYGAITPEQARQKAQKVRGEVLDGADPLRDKELSRAMPTFSEWVDDYMVDVRQRKKHPDHDDMHLGRAKERFGSVLLNEVTRDDILALMRQLAKRGTTNVTANRFLASVRACLNAAIAAGKIRDNPAATIKKYAEPIPRSRTLSDDEFKLVVEAIGREEDIYAHTALHMLVETGARKTEVLTAKWADIDFEGGLWRIPSPKAGRPQMMPLPKSTAAMLHVLPRVGPYIFPGKNADEPRRGIKRQWDRVREEAGIPDVRLHDVRRTFGLHVARSAGLHVASKLLRHSDVRVTEQVYAPLGIEDLREAMEKRSQAKVVPLRRKN